MTTYEQIQEALYEVYERTMDRSDGSIDIDKYRFVFFVPGGGDYSSTEVEIEDYYVDHENEKIVVGTESSVEHYRKAHS